MIIATGSCSKKFGDICYTFVIFSTNISDYIIEHTLTRINDNNYPLYFFLVILVNCFLHIFCVYILVGSRINLLMSNPEFDANSASTDASQYIALRSKLRSMSIVRRISTIIPFSKSEQSNSSQTKSDDNSFRFSNPGVHVI